MAATIDIPGIGEKRFDDVDQFRSWLKEEREHYAWIEQQFPRDLQRVRDQWKQQDSSAWWKQIQELRKLTDPTKGQAWSDETIDHIQSEIDNRLRNFRCLWSETLDGQFIDSVRTNHNDTAALGALVYLSRAAVPSPENTFRDFWDGWGFAFLYSNGFQKNVPKRYRRIDSLADEFRAELGERNREGSEALKQVNDEREALQEERATIARESARQFEVMRKLRKRFIREAHRKFDEQHRMVAEHISMHKSVEHWDTKAGQFSDEAKTWGRCYYSSIGIGTILIIASIYFAARYLVTASPEVLEDVSTRLELIGNFYIVATGAVALAVGMWLWATRMFGRLYLEARAQKEDAEHRVTTIKSYLAMLTDEGAFEKDAAREIILPAIFDPPRTRPTDAGGPPGWLDRVMRAVGARA